MMILAVGGPPAGGFRMISRLSSVVIGGTEVWGKAPGSTMSLLVRTPRLTNCPFWVIIQDYNHGCGGGCVQAMVRLMMFSRMEVRKSSSVGEWLMRLVGVKLVSDFLRLL